MNKLLVVLCLTFATKCGAQLSIVNLSMADSTSKHLKACGENLIKIEYLPRGAHAEMLHSIIQMDGNFIRISGAEHDDSDKDTLNVFDGSKMFLARAIFTYDSCYADQNTTAGLFNKKVFLGGKTNKGTLQKDYCHYSLGLSVSEILANPEVLIADTRYKISHISVSYRLRRQCDIMPAHDIQSGSLLSQLSTIRAMTKGQIIFIDDIKCVNVRNPRVVYNLCPFTVTIQ